MSRTLGLVARSRNAHARAEAKHAKWLEDAPIRAQHIALRDLDRAKGEVLSAAEGVAEAEAAIAKWKAALAQYRDHAGLHAEPVRVRDLSARIDISHEALASRRHALAAAEARLAALVPAPAPAAEKPKKVVV